MIHVADCVKRGHRRAAIRTVDTDVVHCLLQLQHNSILLSYGLHLVQVKHPAILGYIMIVQHIGLNRFKALPMFHSLTGCDTVSTFAGRRKKLSWVVWNVFRCSH